VRRPSTPQTVRDPRRSPTGFLAEPLGIIGADPLDGEHIMHLHFEVWRGRAGNRFDPQRLIETTWEYLPDPGDLPRTLVARSAGHRPRDGSGYSVPVQFHYRRPPRR
jgi:hypothetical protein